MISFEIVAKSFARFCKLEHASGRASAPNPCANRPPLGAMAYKVLCLLDVLNVGPFAVARVTPRGH